MLPRVRHLTRIARRLRLDRACRDELARLRKAAVEAIPVEVVEGPDTVRVENVSMKAMVFGNEERSAA